MLWGNISSISCNICPIFQNTKWQRSSCLGFDKCQSCLLGHVVFGETCFCSQEFRVVSVWKATRETFFSTPFLHYTCLTGPAIFSPPVPFCTVGTYGSLSVCLASWSAFVHHVLVLLVIVYLHGQWWGYDSSVEISHWSQHWVVVIDRWWVFRCDSIDHNTSCAPVAFAYLYLTYRSFIAAPPIENLGQVQSTDQKK